MPKRPIQAVVDRDFVILNRGASASVTLTNHGLNSLSFTLLTNDRAGYSAAESEMSVLEAGESCEITIRVGNPVHTPYEEICLIQFADGFSIPIGVRIKE